MHFGPIKIGIRNNIQKKFISNDIDTFFELNKKNETFSAESHDDDEKEKSFKHELNQHLKGHIDESV